CSAGSPVSGTPALTSVRFASGFSSPLDLQTPPGDHARVFVVEQPGRIRIVKNGTVLGTPFLDIASRVSFGGERGLLGLAFHRRYCFNSTDPRSDTHTSEFRAPASADVADPGSERVLLTVVQPFANHNGGGLVFGPEGKLYAGLGDGGSGGDPFGNGQNLGTP